MNEAQQASKNAPKLQIFDTSFLTDVGNARELVVNHGQDIRYVSAWKAWMHWNGKIWERLDDDKKGYPQLLIEYAKETAMYFKASADNTITNPDIADEYRKHAKRSQSDAKIKAMINLVTGERGIIKSAKDFDNNPFLFNCQNGTLNMLTGEFREHRREDYMTKISPVEYNPLAQCSLWLSVLERIMRGNPEMIAYLQNLAGQCLTGEVREKSFYIFWGVGDTGKTTFIEAIQFILDEYAQNIPIAALIKENKTSIPVDLHSLKGARMAFASEPDFGDTLTDGLIKRITGKDTMKTRTLHEKPTQWKPEFKLIIATNNLPKIPDASAAMWSSRVKCVPFVERIPFEEQDKTLGEKLKLEASGLLNWMITGCKEWLRSGMKEPEIVTQTVLDYQENSDKLADFFNYCFEKDTNGFVPFKLSYPLYKLWCANHDQRPVAENTLPQLLENRGYVRGRGWYKNAKNEKVRDRGNYGMNLLSWLSGFDKTAQNCDMACHSGQTTGQTPVHLIIELIDSDYEQAKWLFGQVDRLSLVDSIYLVSCKDLTNTVSRVSNMSNDTDIPIFPLDSDSVQSVQSVQNNINKQIITTLKESYDKWSLDNILEVYKSVEKVKEAMELKIQVEIPDLPENINISRYIDDYFKVRGWNISEAKSQRDKIKTLRTIIQEIQTDTNCAAPQESIISAMTDKGIQKEVAEDMLQKLKFSGELIEASQGMWRVV